MNDSDKTDDVTQSGELWPMGAVTRRTGISEHTLRAWERRFGFPKPIRLASGHRRFSSDQVRQLLVISRALSCGYRAGDIVPLPLARVQALVRECDDKEAQERRSAALARRWVAEVIRHALAFDEESVRHKISADAAFLGVSRYLRERAVPLINELGEAWARGEIGIRHEHFVSRLLEENLRAVRAPFGVAALGRPVVLACLPDELHGLGLQLVAAEIASLDRRCVILGPSTPIDEIVATASSVDAAAVALSVSVYSASKATLKGVSSLSSKLPARCQLWVGGGGLDLLDGLPEKVRRLQTLDDVAEAVRFLPD